MSVIAGQTVSLNRDSIQITSAVTINVNQSTISGNSAYEGGGVGTYDYGTVILTNSTVSGNNATYYGRILETHIGPGCSTVEAFVNTVAEANMTTTDVFTGSDPYRFGAVAMGSIQVPN